MIRLQRPHQGYLKGDSNQNGKLKSLIKDHWVINIYLNIIYIFKK